MSEPRTEHQDDPQTWRQAFEKAEAENATLREQLAAVQQEREMARAIARDTLACWQGEDEIQDGPGKRGRSASSRATLRQRLAALSSPSTQEPNKETKMSSEPEIARCGLCGEPMPAGEEMFKYHGYSGPCPKPPALAAEDESDEGAARPEGSGDSWAPPLRRPVPLATPQTETLLADVPHEEVDELVATIYAERRALFPPPDVERLTRAIRASLLPLRAVRRRLLAERATHPTSAGRASAIDSLDQVINVFEALSATPGERLQPQEEVGGGVEGRAGMSERETALKAVRLKAIKLLEALAERCERPEDEDHDCHTCRSCVAAFSLTQPGEKSLLRLLLDELMAAGADPVPVCQWRETPNGMATGCGHESSMLPKRPTRPSIGWKYCPYCGKPVALVPAEGDR